MTFMGEFRKHFFITPCPRENIMKIIGIIRKKKKNYLHLDPDQP